LKNLEKPLTFSILTMLVQKKNYKTTLETSGEDVAKHSKRVEKMSQNTRNEWRNSGVIDSRELKAAMRALGFDVKKDQIKRMLSDIGKNPSEMVNFEEFVLLMQGKMVRKKLRHFFH
jgi:Ca2+-binding EF-hand superfamily protein